VPRPIRRTVFAANSGSLIWRHVSHIMGARLRKQDSMSPLIATSLATGDNQRFTPRENPMVF
jgi:hypothetical protein